MIKTLIVLLAIIGIIYFYKSSKRQKWVKNIDEMDTEELVEAILKGEISVVEVPESKRDAVNLALEDVKKKMEHPN